jgi:DNA polymerase-3 subunit delta
LLDLPFIDINRIQNQEIINNLLLIGSEEYLIEQNLKLILDKQFPKRNEDYNFYNIDSEEQDLGHIFDLANSFPMLGDKITIVCKNFQNYFKGRQKKNDPNLVILKKYFENPSPTTNIILTVCNSKFSKVTEKLPSPYNLIEKNSQVIFHPKIWPDKFSTWLKNKFQYHGVNVSDRVIGIILSQTPENLRDIGNQVDKIITFLGGGKNLDEELVFQIIGNSRQFNIFELKNQIAQRNLDNSLYIAENIYKNSRSELFTLSANLFSLFKNALRYSYFANQSPNQYDIARNMGVSFMAIKEIASANLKYNSNEIEKIFILLSNADFKLKTSTENELIVISKLITEVVKK